MTLSIFSRTCLLWENVLSFLTGLSFLLLNCRSSLYILDARHLSDIWFGDIFFFSVGFFTLLIVSFDVHKNVLVFIWLPWVLVTICGIFYLFIWLHWVLFPARGVFRCGLGTLSCDTWDLVSWAGMKPRLLHWDCGVLATGPPRKSWKFFNFDDSKLLMTKIT